MYRWYEFSSGFIKFGNTNTNYWETLDFYRIGPITFSKRILQRHIIIFGFTHIKRFG